MSSGGASATLVVGADGGVTKAALEQQPGAAVAAAWDWSKQPPQPPMVNGFMPPGGAGGVQWQQVRLSPSTHCKVMWNNSRC